MGRERIVHSALAVAGVWLMAVGCGSRTGLPNGRLGTSGGDAGTVPDAAPPPECVIATDCPPLLPSQCGAALCLAGVCSVVVEQTCDDGDPCTEDSCMGRGCVFVDGRVDGDNDGYDATGVASDPRAPLGCGNDCDDTRAQVFPGSPESCDGIDNDCDNVIDEGAQLVATGLAAKRVSGLDLDHASAAGLAFDGQNFGATFTGVKCPGMPSPDCLLRAQGYFRQLSLEGDAVAEQKSVARVNAESYGGPLLWTGERYLTAYQDARQDTNYEIYFDVLNRQGERLIEDLRVSNAEDFSVRPALVWTGTETLVVWDDRRLESSAEAAAIFGQRIAADGTLLSENVRLSPPGMQGESVSIALGQGRLGVAFTSVSPTYDVRVVFMTTSLTLDAPSASTTIDFVDPDSPVLTLVNGKYVVTFAQQDSGAGPSIFGAVLGQNGNLEIAPMPITSGAAHARSHATYSYGDRFVMVWADDLDGSYQLYAQTFDEKLAALSQRQRVTNSSSLAYGPAIAPASDGSLGVLFTDEGTGQKHVYFSRLTCSPLAGPPPPLR